MKSLTKPLPKKWILLTGISLFIFSGCQKFDWFDHHGNGHGHLKQTKDYSSDVAIKWMNMQLRLMSTATGIPNVAFARPYAYSGISLYEAVVPGMPSYQSLAGKLNGLSGLPQTHHGVAYHWPSSANAALANITKQMFQTTSAANKISIDSLENALNNQYQGEADSEAISRSIAFGKAVAQKVFEWAETD